MFSEKVGELFVELSARKGNLEDAMHGANRQWQELVAKQGKFGAALTVTHDRLSKVRNVIGEVMANAPISFGGAMAWMDRMAAAASPEIWATFTGSWRYLSAVIGTSFTPALITASRWIQQTAHWLQSLGPTGRNTIAWVGTAVVAFLGFATILQTAVTWTMRLIDALRLLRITQLATAAAGLITGGGGAAAGAAGGSIGGAAATGVGATAAGGIGGTGLGLGSGVVLPAAIGAALGIGAGAGMWQHEVNQAMGQQSGWITQLGNALAYIVPSLGTRAYLQSLFGAEAALGIHPGTSIMQGLPGGVGAALGYHPPAGVGAALSGQGQGQGLLTDMNFQSQFFGIEDQWRRMQQAAASLSPLQAQIVQINNEQWGALMQAATGIQNAVPQAGGMQ